MNYYIFNKDLIKRSYKDGNSVIESNITHRLSLYRKSKDIDYLTKSTLCSIFVPSADAWIVYRFNEKLNKE